MNDVVSNPVLLPQNLRGLIADDERLMREQLQSRLTQAWPELQICGTARDGNSAVDMADALRPDVVFLDIRMPGMTGIEAAREILSLDNWRGAIVFVTAFDEYAVDAFEQGALDYLLKPVELDRLRVTVERIKSRFSSGFGTVPSDAKAGADGQASREADSVDQLLDKLLQLQQQISPAQSVESPLKWLQCGAGSVLKLVHVDEVLFFRSDEKYTRVQTATHEYLIRTPIRELVPQLDPQKFWQIHRSTIVNLGCVASVQRDETGRQKVSLRDHREVLEVSRGFTHLLRQN